MALKMPDLAEDWIFLSSFTIKRIIFPSIESLHVTLQECELQPTLQEFAACHRPDNHQFDPNVRPFSVSTH
jgi:hypothetical protein